MVAARQVLLHLHRWAGLAMSAFLTLAGLTGAVIAFQGELDALLNPGLYQARTSGPSLTPDQLAARIAAKEPHAEISYLAFGTDGQSAQAFLRPRPEPTGGDPVPLANDQVFLDPATGDILGGRRWGSCCFSPDRLIPFLYRFHYTLAAGEPGQIFMGSVAILWAADCFVGVMLTLLRGKPFLGKWRIAWTIKRGVGGHRLTLDLHRAFALWLWLLLLLMAISGVALALQEPVFRPVLNAVLPLTTSPVEQAGTRPAPMPGRGRIGFDHAVAIAAAEGERRDWGLVPGAVFDAGSAGAYVVYFFSSPSDRGTGLGRPVVYVDDSTGEIMQVDVPGEGTAGDTVLDFQLPLHSGQIAGLAGRIAIAALGVLTAMLSVTGVLIWDRKRRSRQHSVRIRLGARRRNHGLSAGRN